MAIPHPLRTLRVTIPAVLLVLALVMGAISVWVDWRGTQAELLEHAREHAFSSTLRLLGSLEAQVVHGDLDGMQRLLASHGGDLDVQTAVAPAPDGRLLAASRPEWTGRSLDDVPLLQEPRDRQALRASIAEARALRRGQLFAASSSRTIAASVPSDRLRADVDRSAGRGDALLVVYDLHRDHTHALARQHQRAAVQALAALVMALGLGWSSSCW